MQITLYKLDENLKKILSTFLIVLTIGVSVGIIYLNLTTKLSPKGTVERYNGSQADEFEIAENYPKPVSELLLTTHNHVITFALIFGFIGIIFFFNSIITRFWKNFIIIEPLISTLVTFSSIWAMRFIDENFVYVTIVSATLMYASFYVMSVISLYELIFKSDESQRK